MKDSDKLRIELNHQFDGAFKDAQNPDRPLNKDMLIGAYESMILRLASHDPELLRECIKRVVQVRLRD